MTPTETVVPAAAEASPPRISTAAATWALFCGIGLVMTGNGLQGSLIGVRSQAEGFGLVVTGAVMACYFVGFLAGTDLAVRFLATVGHIRVFAALASLASSAVLIHALAVNPVSWALMRLVTGACMASMYVVAESWLNALATNATRGRLLAIYMVVMMGGMTSGQLLLATADTNGFRLFIVASLLVSLALVPVSLSETSTPPVRAPRSMSLRKLARIVPTGVVTSYWVGTAHGTLMGLGAVYAASVGMSAHRIALFLAAPLVGAIVFQWPVGLLSDRVSRRAVILGVAVLAAATSFVLVLAPTGSWTAIGLMFVLGGGTFPLYSLAVAYTNDWIEPEEIVGASAELVRLTGIGAITGPLATAALMASFGNEMFFWTLVTVHAIIACYLVARISMRPPMPLADQEGFVPYPARASGLAAQLLRRRPNGDPPLP